MTGGMYPFSVPTDPVRSAMAEMGYPDPQAGSPTGSGRDWQPG